MDKLGGDPDSRNSAKKFFLRSLHVIIYLTFGATEIEPRIRAVKTNSMHELISSKSPALQVAYFSQRATNTTLSSYEKTHSLATTSPFTCPFLCSFPITSHRSLLRRQTWPFANFARDSNPAYLHKNSQSQNPHTTSQKHRQKQVKRTVQNTNEGDPAQENEKQATPQTNCKLTIKNRSSCATRAPLAMEIVSTMRGLEMLEEKWQAKLYTRRYTLNDGHSTRLYTSETKVIP